MREDLGDYSGIFDGGDDRQGAAAVGTLFAIDHPFEQPGPAPAGWYRVMGCVTVVRGGGIRIDRRARKARHRDGACLAPRGCNDLGTEPRVGGEHTVEARARDREWPCLARRGRNAAAVKLESFAFAKEAIAKKA
ncbi:hypothetical protein BH18PSE1_BH18PSE1_08720 [soil metagenome]